MLKKYSILLKTLFFFAVPLISANLVNAASSLISMFLLAKINTNALAAGALITSTYGFIIMMAISVLYSVSIMTGQFQGARQPQEVGAVFFSGLIIAILFGLPLTALMMNMSPLFERLGQSPQISALAGEYFQGLAMGLIPSLVGAVLTQFLMGTSRAKSIFYLTLLGVIVNSILSNIFIFGTSFIAPMGVFGAGFASAVTAYLLLGIALLYVSLNKQFHPYQLFVRASWRLTYLPLLLKIGMPISIQYSVELLAFSVLTYLMGILGTQALSAQQIVLQCSMIAIMITMAVSQSGSILLSQAIGQNNPKEAREIANVTFILGTLFMVIIAIIYLFFPLHLISLYLNINDTNLATTVSLAKTLLMIGAFTQLADNGRNIAAGLLRGYRDTQYSMWVSIIACWGIGLPLAYCLGFFLHWGAAGLRLGMLMGILFGCLTLMVRFYGFNKNSLKNLALVTDTSWN